MWRYWLYLSVIVCSVMSLKTAGSVMYFVASSTNVISNVDFCHCHGGISVTGGIFCGWRFLSGRRILCLPKKSFFLSKVSEICFRGWLVVIVISVIKLIKHHRFPNYLLLLYIFILTSTMRQPQIPKSLQIAFLFRPAYRIFFCQMHAPRHKQKRC